MTSISSYGGSKLPLGGGNADWVHARFDRAVDIVQSLPRSGPIQTNYDDKLLLYSCYKQATEGDLKTSRPGLLDVLGRAKWDAWNKRKGMNQEEAERMYVNGLLKILKGYSDRTQAVELIRELETFSLDPRAMVMSGSLAPSESSSSSTEGEPPVQPPPRASSSRRDSSSRTGGGSAGGRRSRHRAPRAPAPPVPPLPSSSASRHHHHHQRQHHSRGARAPASTAASASVAPSLPGYGPPRTRADSPRRPGSSSSGDSTGSDSGDYSSAAEEEEQQQQRLTTAMTSRGGATGGLQPPFQPTQPHSSSSGSHQRQQQRAFPGEMLPPPPPPTLLSPGQQRVLSPPPHPTAQLRQPYSQPPSDAGTGHVPFSPYVSHLQAQQTQAQARSQTGEQQFHTPRGGSVAGMGAGAGTGGLQPPPSPGMSAYGGGGAGGGYAQQQQAVAYPPGMTLAQAQAQAQAQQIARAQARQVVPAQQLQQQAGLDAALDRIQTSLTALHERLADVERGAVRGRSDLTSSSTAARIGYGGGGCGSRSNTAILSSSASADHHVFAGGGGTWPLLRALTLRLLVALKIRSPDALATSLSQSLLRVSLSRLFFALVSKLARTARRVVGEIGAVILVLGLVGRLMGRVRGGVAGAGAGGAGGGGLEEGVRNVMEGLLRVGFGSGTKSRTRAVGQ